MIGGKHDRKVDEPEILYTPTRHIKQNNYVEERTVQVIEAPAEQAVA
jgi:hypothetical protein